MAPIRCARIGILAPAPAIKALRPHTVFDNLHRVVQPKALGEGMPAHAVTLNPNT